MVLHDPWDDYNLNWLFDPDRFDHLSIEEQLRLYKGRDLRPAKLYKCAAKIWGGPKSRVRRIVAPPMIVHRGSTDSSNVDEDRRAKEFSGSSRNLDSAELCSGSVVGLDRISSRTNGCDAEVFPGAVSSFRKWLEERKALRKGIESLGLTSEWLARKPDKTPLELRVLKKMKEQEEEEEEGKQPSAVRQKPMNEDDETRRPATASVAVPVVKCPLPEAVLIIERFLYDRKLRLIDLFQDLDKNKNWRITIEDFQRAIKRNGIPLTESQVEELLMVFGDEKTGSLRYRDFAHSLETWRKEKKDTRAAAELDRRSPEVGTFGSDMLGETIATTTPGSLRSSTLAACQARSDLVVASEHLSTRSSAVGSSASPGLSQLDSSGLLQPPDLDLRQEQMVGMPTEAMVDRRRRTRHTLHLRDRRERLRPRLTPTTETETNLVVKTGDQDIDRHCAPSTVRTDPAESIDRYRQLLLREYVQLEKLREVCRLPLTTEVLRRALLYPEDKQTDFLMKELRRPKKCSAVTVSRNTSLISPDSSSSRSTADGARSLSNASTNTRDNTLSPDWKSHRKPISPIEASTGQNHIQKLARSFRSERSINDGTPRIVRLSTGKARISRKVDCWMTFEEFVQLTTEQNRSSKAARKVRRTRRGAYSPGQLLDKVRLALAPGDGQSVFHHVNPRHPRATVEHITTI